MKKNKNLVIVLLVVLAMSITALFFIKNEQKKKAQKLLDDAAKAALKPTTNNGTGSTATPPFIDDRNPIKVVSDLKGKTVYPINVGSTGKAVAMLQVAIDRPITGVCDMTDATRAMLYQQSLPMDFVKFKNLIFPKEFKKYFPLKKGVSNKYVAALQIILGVGVDGKFGNDTEKAIVNVANKKVIDYQTFWNLFNLEIR